MQKSGWYRGVIDFVPFGAKSFFDFSSYSVITNYERIDYFERKA